MGETLTIVGWSPRSMKGEQYRLCVTLSKGRICEGSSTFVLKGTVPERFGTWKVARGEGRRGVFTLSLQVKGRTRALDTAALR